jgi:hypothetical protein
MLHSEQINELATALAKAQGTMGGALKDSANPFFKSRYADLESVWTACRKALAENGLSVVQSASETDAGVAVTTMLLHSSGQWMRDTLPLHPKDTSPQGIGSAITYGRRYALAAMAGVYQTDDDAEAAHGRHAQAEAAPEGRPAQPQNFAAAKALADKFREALKTGIDGRVHDIHIEANRDQDLYLAASQQLKPAEKTAIKAAVERMRVPNTNRANAVPYGAAG